MDELGSLKKKLALQEERIKKLEAAVYEDVYENDTEKVVAPVSVSSPIKRERSHPKISFNQVITVLGILGISIGAISFFFYAIANGWIGEAAQVGIGVLFGLALFIVAYSLREKNLGWSNVVFGGAYFIEYLSVGVGVSVYEVMPEILGIIFSFFILVSSMVLTVKFSSRAIAYFSLIGGFIIPIITDTFESQIFVLIWYLLILIALTVVSISFNWGELRAVMLGLMTIFMWSSFGRGEKGLEFLFLGLYFVLFNVSSMVNTVMKNKEMNGLDSFILGVLPFVILPLIVRISESSSNAKLFGLIVILFSFVYLLEVVYLKGQNLAFSSVIYTLIATGIAALNIGLYFMLEEFFGLEFFMILFVVEWALFSYLSSDVKDGFYKGISFVFLALIALWYFSVLNFLQGILHATFFLIVLACVPLVSFLLFRSGINYKASAATFIISGYLFLYSFSKYLALFIVSDSLVQIILSVTWLIYTLSLFVQVQTKEGKLLVGALLGITLLKIAFVDLLSLHGASRIVGFIIFGILLLIGGYFLGNENKK